MGRVSGKSILSLSLCSLGEGTGPGRKGLFSDPVSYLAQSFHSRFFVARTLHFVAKTIGPLSYPFTPSAFVNKSLIFSRAHAVHMCD